MTDGRDGDESGGNDTDPQDWFARQFAEPTSPEAADDESADVARSGSDDVAPPTLGIPIAADVPPSSVPTAFDWGLGAAAASEAAGPSDAAVPFADELAVDAEPASAVEPASVVEPDSSIERASAVATGDLPPAPPAPVDAPAGVVSPAPPAMATATGDLSRVPL